MENKIESLKINGAKKVELIKKNDDNTKEYRIIPEKDYDIRKTIFSDLAKENITIFELKKPEITLEEAFMELIQKNEKDKEEKEKLQEEVSSSAKKRAKEIKIKVVKIAAKKVVSNYKNIGYCMRITEFMNSAIPIKMGPDAELNRQKYTKQKEFFLDMVGYEGRKLRMKNARSTIAELLQKEEERHKQGEIKKMTQNVCSMI